MNREQIIQRILIDKELKYNRSQAEIMADEIIKAYIEDEFEKVKRKNLRELSKMSRHDF